MARLEWTSDWASEDRFDVLPLDHVALHRTVGDIVNPADGCLVDKPVEIGSTAAIADSTALELMSASKAKCSDCAPVGKEDIEDVLFARNAAKGILLEVLALDLDGTDTGECWPQDHRFWGASTDFEKPAGLPSLYNLR